MPTHHVLPESAELLQEIADALWKAKKVLVVTGAGISTNSGIPDFRSKNGLYSLIQAQFEAAAATKDDDEPEDERDEPEPVSKRQRRSEEEEDNLNDEQTPATDVQDAPTTTRRGGQQRGRKSQVVPARQEDTIHCASQDPLDDEGSTVVQLPALDPKKFAQPLLTPQRRSCSRLAAVGDSIECLGSLPQSSSPLSSPPSILFDPSEEFRSGSATSARSSSSNSSIAASTCSSDAESDSEDTPSSSQPILSSQSSFASCRSTLPVMKGRDLFDASIWADPVKTSVFYTFATTLRQKVKEVVPTRSHEFISHLRDTNKLVRCYTQNIDEIEEKVGLSTSLVLGPGKKGRFSTRSASRTSMGSVMAGKDESCSQEAQADGKEQESQELASSQDSQSSEDPSASQSQTETKNPAKNRDPCFRGVECVFLHGSLRLLRCFRCGQTTPWDEAGREHETMSGRQPSCPRCAGATAAREGRGKRALAVGKLRPDIVLYGEEHPNAHLISPIVQHDISLTPDMLLILGTSLKVHGLKVLVREFSKAVHSRGGKVVFVNFTKPPESVWSDVIDYWVQWDCDTWVEDLKQKKPIMWLPPGSVVEEPKKKRKSISTGVTKGGKRNSEGAKTEETADIITISNENAEAGGENTAPSGGCEGSEMIEGAKEKKKKGRPPKEKKEKKEKLKKKEESPPGTTQSTQFTDAATPPEEEEKEAGEKTRPRAWAHNPNAKWPAEEDGQTNGAFTVWKIVQELSQVTSRTEELLPAKPSRVAPAKRKPKQRHSAPGELEIIPPDRDQLDDALAPPKQSWVPLPAIRFLPPLVSHVEPPQPQTQTTINAPAPSAKPLADIPTNVAANITSNAATSSPRTGPDKYSILSAVKANPRRRQSKKIFEGGGSGTGGPMMVQVQQQQQQRKQAKARGRSKSMGTPLSSLPPLDEPATPITLAKLSDAAWSDTDRLAAQLMMELNTFQPASAESVKALAKKETPLAPRCATPVHDPSPSQADAPAPAFYGQAEAHSSSPSTAAVSQPSMRPPTNATVLPPIWQLFPDLQPRWSTDNAFFYQDPLGSRYSYPPPQPRPPQEWSCTDQLEREAGEHLKAVVDIHGRRQ